MLLFYINDANRERAEHPFMRVGAEEVDVFDFHAPSKVGRSSSKCSFFT